MHSPLLARVAALLIGVGGGAGLALAARSHSTWTLSHPGTVLLGIAGLLLLALVYVQARMNVAERGHEERADLFRMAMLAQFAPETLQQELVTDEMLASVMATEPMHVS